MAAHPGSAPRQAALSDASRRRDRKRGLDGLREL